MAHSCGRGQHHVLVVSEAEVGDLAPAAGQAGHFFEQLCRPNSVVPIAIVGASTPEQHLAAPSEYPSNQLSHGTGYSSRTGVMRHTPATGAPPQINAVAVTADVALGVGGAGAGAGAGLRASDGTELPPALDTAVKAGAGVALLLPLLPILPGAALCVPAGARLLGAGDQAARITGARVARLVPPFSNLL